MVSQDAATAERARALTTQLQGFKAGESERSGDDLLTDLFGFMIDTVPMLETSAIAPLALLDVTPLGIQLASSRQDWATAAQIGAVLASAVVAIRQRSDRQSVDDDLERELGHFIGAHLDEFFYSLAKMDRAVDVGVFADFLLEGGFAGRQFLQLANPDVKRAWDWATGMLANGGATLTDDELRERLSKGAWLSERQRSDLNPGDAIETMMTWAREALAILATVPSVSLVAEGGSGAWRAILDAVEKARQVSPQMRLAFAGGAGCITPLAARESGRDIVYLVAGSAGGAAIRFFGGIDHERSPEVLDLPDAGLVQVREIAHALEQVSEFEGDDLGARSALIDEVRTRVGRSIASIVLERWPERGSTTFVPIGQMQTVPIASALVEGRRLNSIIDLTVTPNAALLLLSSAASTPVAPRTARVMGDPASGSDALPWVIEEAHEVAAVYGRHPDLVVDYGEPRRIRVDGVRSTASTAPTLNTTSEHILSRLEDASILHLACHGYVPAESGLPGLLLGGVLTFDALEHHRFSNGATVVLSACSVGRSISQAPFAQLGFPAMLLSTGASEVVASSQPLIDCRETVDLMVALHQCLLSGHTAAEALARATEHVESEGVPSAIWGSFEVYGAPPTGSH